MSRNEQMIRFQKMTRYLGGSTGGHTIREMAAHFNVNSKTIRRDLALMKKAGINLVEMNQNAAKSYRIVEDEEKKAAREKNVARSLRLMKQGWVDITPLLLGQAIQFIPHPSVGETIQINIQPRQKKKPSEGRDEKRSHGKLPHQYP